MGNRCQWKLIEREVRHEIQSISFWARKIFVFSSKLKQEIHFIKINLLKSFQAKKKTSHRLNCEIIIRVFGLALLLHKFRSVARNRTLNMQNCLECCHPQTQFSVCSHPAYAISFHFLLSSVLWSINSSLSICQIRFIWYMLFKSGLRKEQF